METGESRGFEALYELVEAVGRAEVIEDIYEHALNSLKRTLEPDRAAILLLDQGVMRFVAWRGISEEYRRQVEGHSPWPADERDPQSVLVSDALGAEDLKGQREALEREGIGALAFIPLVHRGSLLGKFMLYYDRIREFSPLEIREAEAIAAHIAFTIEQRRSEDLVRMSEQRLRHVLDSTQTATWEWDIQSDRVRWSDNLVPMYGLTRAEEPDSVEGFLAMVHPEDRSGLEEAIRGAVERGEDYEVEFRVVWPDGSLHWLHAPAHVLADEQGRPSLLMGLTWDVTGRRRREEQAGFLAEASHVLSRSLDFRSTLLDVARLAVSRVSDWCLVVAAGEEDDAPLELALAHADPELEDKGRRTFREYPPDSDATLGIPRVIRTGESELYESIDEGALRAAAKSSEHFRLLTGLGIGSAMVVPLRARRGVLGAMVLVTSQPGHYGPADLAFAEEFARRAALAVENGLLYEEEQRSRRAVQAAEERLRFLAEAGEILSRSLDQKETLEGLGMLIVPRLADFCTINLVGRDGSIRRVVAEHADPLRGAELAELLDLDPHDPQAETGVPWTIRTGRSQLFTEVSPDLLRQMAHDDEYLATIEALNMRSFMIVPLLAPGRTIGAMSLVSSDSGRRYGEEDLMLAEMLARRAAMAIENSRLFEDRAHIAHTLQRSLLPPYLPKIPWVDLAARYVAEGEGNEVGGDFYDAFQISDGWAVTVGDVQGKGPEAAALVGLARHTIRAAAIHDASPLYALTLLNQMMIEQESKRFCTAAYAHLRRVGSNLLLRLASAGHPPPVVVRGDGTVETIGGSGMMLGMFPDPELTEAELVLAQGEAIVFYTDGVLADETENLDDIIQALAGRQGASAKRLANAVRDLAMAHHPDGLRDDLAILALKHRTTGRGGGTST